MQYRTVVIDPPWDMPTPNNLPHDHSTKHGSALPYKTMTDTEIRRFAIDDFAASDCDLFVWSPHRKLPAALKISESWGFAYKHLIIWYKKQGINSVGVHYDSELLVRCVRGTSAITRSTTPYMHTVQYYQRTRHSEKPAGMYAALKRRTAAPRIDIFARRRHDGFDAYGDQVVQLTNWH